MMCPPAGALCAAVPRPPLADSWYSLSYLYLSAVGFITTLSVGLLITSLTGNLSGGPSGTVSLPQSPQTPGARLLSEGTGREEGHVELGADMTRLCVMLCTYFL